jgi:nicotinate-nucleotide adenylyltransferase
MRIGAFGGTFDPIHLGHLIMAEQCREQAALDQVWFIPAPRPPHKQDKELASFAQRVEMLALAIAGYPVFKIDETEKNRPGPSYTVDTLAELKLRHPEDEFFLIVGADSLEDFPLWYQPVRILELASLLTVDRPGWKFPAIAEVEARLNLPPGVSFRSQVVHFPLIDISSTDIRQRAGSGRSIRYLVPRAVEVYIQEKKLYQAHA